MSPPGLNRVGPAFLNDVKVEWDAEQRSRFDRMTFELSIATTEPVAFYAAMGLAAAELPALHPLAPGNAPRLSLILQSKATEALNVAISDPKRACSNPVMLSVLFLIGQAFLCGQGEMARTLHLPALRRMTELRGGIRAIAEEDNGLMFARWLVWGDRMYAATCGAEAMFSDFEDASMDETDWARVWPRVRKINHSSIEGIQAAAQRNIRKATRER
jgi:hypothetical protein